MFTLSKRYYLEICMLPHKLYTYFKKTCKTLFLHLHKVNHGKNSLLVKVYG